MRGQQQATGRMRRGLPRVPGGQPWPPFQETVEQLPVQALPAAVPSQVPRSASAARRVMPAAAPARRRGLPRVGGGEPWPPPPVADPDENVPDTPAVGVDSDADRVVSPVRAAVEPAIGLFPETSTLTSGLPGDREALPAVVPVAETPSAPPRPNASRPRRWLVRGRNLVLGIVGLVLVCAVLALAARGAMSFDAMQRFTAAYPGHYALPEAAAHGFPAWLGWQHFFNVFLMVLIIRSGISVRTEKRPALYWTPRSLKGGRKISITLWLHQALDVLWLVNGAIFVVLMFATGHWMRIVPTSWDVFPNALSALLQYVSLDWPTENGWVNYNSLQQLMYFTTVFIAAPLAALTGARLSESWPKTAQSLNRGFPVEVARAIHFPVMLYFVGFIIVHVALVFATGALRNLNHIYAGQDVVNWAGFWIFVASIGVIVAGWMAARPMIIAQLARAFGKVSSR